MINVLGNKLKDWSAKTSSTGPGLLVRFNRTNRVTDFFCWQKNRFRSFGKLEYRA